jgi:hypothetical protein
MDELIYALDLAIFVTLGIPIFFVWFILFAKLIGEFEDAKVHRSDVIASFAILAVGTIVFGIAAYTVLG